MRRPTTHRRPARRPAKPLTVVQFEEFLWDLLREVRWAGEDRNVGSAFHDYARRCGRVREVGTFLRGDGRRGLTVTTGRGKFLVTVERHPATGGRARGRRT